MDVRKLKIWNMVLAVAFVAAVASCSNGECTENQSSIPLAGFYSMQNKSSISTEVTIYGVGAPGDSVLYSKQTLHEAYLPLQISKNSTQFVFHYEQAELADTKYNDTLTINYKAYPFFASKECGAMFNFEVVDYKCTSNLIDSVSIPVQTFTNADVETIKIFFRTSTAN